MKILSGSELAGFIKERQAKQVRGLRQAEHTAPKLAIVRATTNPVVETYVRMKQRYGHDILIDVEDFLVESDEIVDTIQRLNDDQTVHGIIVQLPLDDESKTDDALAAVTSEKDVDGLGYNPDFIPATAMAIDWLVQGYGIDLSNKRIGIVGNGRLVGAPLAKLWSDGGFDVSIFDKSADLSQELPKCNVIVSAAGVPNLILSNMVSPKTVLVDAATSAEHGKIVGDVENALRERDDLTITPEKGGVGPLTVCALFDNVIRAARNRVENAKG